ncbi:MAG: putative lipid II flippase FtsW [Clostridia bacterium]|nr:putative lipid II flippase FtsW [Clostridia bacterium]
MGEAEYARRPVSGRGAKREKVRKAGFLSGIYDMLKERGWVIEGSADSGFFILVLILLAFGVVMMFSASYVASYYKNGNSYVFFIKQLQFALLGIVVMIAASKFNFRKLDGGLAWLLAGFALACLIAVLFTAPDAGGTRRRLVFFQPSDVAKFVLVLFLAHNMSRQHKYFKNKTTARVCFRAAVKPEIYGQRIVGNKNGLFTANTVLTFYYAAVIGVCAVLILLEHHLSGTILILLIGVSMLAFGGVKPKWFIIAGCVIVPVAVAIIVICKNYKENGILETGLGPIHSYQLERIVAWLDKSYEPTDGRWQINNSLYAIASGGPFGLGFGESRQKQMFVSEPQNDFIFSIICEELGYVGATVIIVLFALLIYKGFVIASTSDDLFGSLLVMGIMAQVGFQVVLNIMVVTDTMPNTGISLPFFSYGGTSLVMLLGEMGLVLSVSRSRNKQAEAA